MRLLQISDPHFGTERPEVVEALVRWTHRQAPDALVLTGDVTQRATAAQMAAAAAFVRRLHVPRVLAIPGNHDIPLFDVATRLLAPYRRWQRAFGHELEPELDADDCLLLCLKTTRRWRHKDGEIDAAQRERIAARLARARPGQLRIVAVHQPVAVIRERDRTDLVHGHAPAVAQWAAAGADLVIGGHIHLPYAMQLAGGSGRSLWAVQAGTALSHRTREGIPNSFNLVISHAPDAAGRSCTLERWDFDAAAGDFTCVSQQRLALSPVALAQPAPLA